MEYMKNVCSIIFQITFNSADTMAEVSFNGNTWFFLGDISIRGVFSPFLEIFILKTSTLSWVAQSNTSIVYGRSLLKIGTLGIAAVSTLKKKNTFSPLVS